MLRGRFVYISLADEKFPLAMARAMAFDLNEPCLTMRP
jgi:hypothetical protein